MKFLITSKRLLLFPQRTDLIECRLRTDINIYIVSSIVTNYICLFLIPRN